MSKREAITRLSLIIKKVDKHPCTYDEISNYLERESAIRDINFTVSKRTFQRDLDEIRAIFDIDIQFDFSRKVYTIRNTEQINTQYRILETFDTFNALNVTDGLSKYIQFENRRPQGTEHFYGLLNAVKNNLVTKFNYYKFWNQTLSIRTVEPFMLKEARNRWYIVAKDCGDNHIKTFGLDRITEIEITQKKFLRPADLNVDNLFRYSMGIINSDSEQPQKIVLSFSKFHGQYILSYPFHQSQKITETANEIIVDLFIKITHDFIMELLSYGENIKVLEPRRLIDEMISIHESAIRVLKRNSI
jgi:predicted DNA-binding transcriptional regulator YafY